MVGGRKFNKNSQFILTPTDLIINNKRLISEEISFLLKSKQIKLVIDVYDTHHSNLDKPTLVFIHGNSASKNVFENQIEHYSKRYRVIAFDLIGHGKSTKICDIDALTTQEKLLLSEAFYNPCTMIAGVKQLFEVNKIEAAHIIGWSLGGHIAYGLAVENPKLVSSITTIGSPPVKLSSQGLMKGFNEWFVHALVPEWVNYPKKYTQYEAGLIALRMGLKIEDKFFTDAFVNADPQMRKNLFFKKEEYDSDEFTGTALDGEYFVKNTHIPLCLIVGENDGGVNADYVKTFIGKFVNQASRVIMMKNAPHAVLNTHTSEMYAIIDNFIAAMDAS